MPHISQTWGRGGERQYFKGKWPGRRALLTREGGNPVTGKLLGYFLLYILLGRNCLPLIPGGFIITAFLWTLPPNPLRRCRHDRLFLQPIYGGHQYFLQKEATKGRSKRKVKHRHFSLRCLISCESIMLTCLIIKSKKIVYAIIST